MTERELERIINKYSRLLWTVASRVLDGVGNEQDAEECVADVFIDLWRHPESFDPMRGDLRSWLSMKCRSKSIDRFRKLTAHMTDELTPELISDNPDPGDELVRRENLRKLQEAISSLDDEAREIIIRRFYLGQKPSQISKAMDLSVRRVENVIYRTKEKLRNELGGSK